MLGNFRDVAQNRRSDNFHSPHVKDFNVQMFLSFVQADGYNPLTVASTNFKVPAASVSEMIAMMNLTNPDVDTSVVQGILNKPYRPGQFFADLKTAGVKYGTRNEDILSRLIYVSEQTAAGNAFTILVSHALSGRLALQVSLLKMDFGQTTGPTLWTWWRTFCPFIQIRSNTCSSTPLLCPSS